MARYVQTPRTREQIREHYLIEKELADTLRKSDREERRHLYAELYDELYRRVPHHPQLTRKHAPEDAVHMLDVQLKLLERYIGEDSVFLEIGAGDCALSIRIAERAKKVYGLDVSKQITSTSAQPANFELVLSDGTSVPVAEGSVDIAYSNQLMEHLHPEDALDQLRAICRALRPGGCYICITPNPLDGPHDVSRGFEKKAAGFHLKEYTARELTELFKQCGFREVKTYAVIKGRFARMPARFVFACEWFLERLPDGLLPRMTRLPPFRFLLGAPVIGIKA